VKVAIIHYWLVNMRGGEKVLKSLFEIFPDADIYTHVYNPKAVSDLIKNKRVVTSRINRLPFAKKIYQLYMPLMPNALNDFDLQSYDLIISSESGPAKGVIPNPGAYHLCYCHSPMRYLWDMYHEYFRGTNLLVRFFMKRLIPKLRLWDAVSANQVDFFVANSSYVAQRIRRCYNREAAIVHPPVDIEKFSNVERKPEDYYLFFGQLIGYKRADIAIEACVASGRRLVVAGAGKKNKKLRKYERTGLITFKGKVSDEDTLKLYSSAKALLFPGIEDFGIIPVEAQAAGCPVIAYRRGGALDTIIDGITGIFFDEQTPASLINAMNRFESMKAEGFFNNKEVFSNHVRQFSPDVFKDKVKRIIEERKRL
jgi:glycosyltransferase involved in cell wall biosynthesis